MSRKKEKKSEQVHLKWFGLPYVFCFIRPYLRLLFFMILTMGLGAVVAACLPLFQNYAINHFVGENTLDTLRPFIFAYLGMVLSQAVMEGIGCYISANLEIFVDRDVRKACFDHVQTLSFSYFNQNSVGYIHSRIISDPNRIGMIFSWGLLDTVSCLVYIVAMCVVMFRLNAGLGLLLLLMVPLITAVTYRSMKLMTDANHKVRELNSIITGNFNEGITGARTIKTLVIEKRMQQDFEADTGKMYAAAVRAGHLRAIYRSSILLLSSIALALMLWRGGVLTSRGLLLVGSLSVFMNYASSLSENIQNLTETFAMLIATQVNIERIHTLLNTGADVVDSPEIVEKYGDAFSPKKENWEELEGDISFEDVTFRYPDGDENVLEHFSQHFPKGSMVAIVGETGAGKSTLVNLVCRFYEPTEGHVLIDGKDVRERSQLWLHSHIGYVLQTPHLFSGTVRENLLYGNPKATEEEMRAALARVRADRVVDRMEKGLDSEVGEGGDLLSTGEKQLISFARALLVDPRILILDEATSSVDTLTEKAIQDAIKTVTAGRTSFVIAHRLSTIRNADLILIMRDGKIVEQGTHSALLKQNGYYAGLYSRQFVQEGEAEALRRKAAD